MIEVRTDIPDLDTEKIGRALLEGLTEFAKGAAFLVLKDHIERVHAGIRPDGSPQVPTTKGGTRGRRKSSLGKTPLIDTGVYADESRYRVVESRPLQFEVVPPASRVKAIDELRKQGFQTFEISDKAIDDIQVLLETSVPSIASSAARAGKGVKIT